MPSNDELMMRAEYVATHSVFELPEGDSDHGLVCYGESAEFLARHVKSTLATEQFNHFEYVCEHLPEDWRIDIRLEQGCADVLLFDYMGEHVDEPFEGEEPDIESMVRARVDYAREKDGLTALGIDTTTSNREGK